MQQMEATRVASEVAQRQHMEALRQLEENGTAAPMYDFEPRPPHQEWSLEDFFEASISQV